jgi:hypothetical protein
VRIVHALVTAGRASAQGRGKGGGGDAKADSAIKNPGEPGGPMDPERPIPFMIEHRKDLLLADSQVAKLGIIENRLDAANRPVQQSLDTLPPDQPAGSIDWAHLTPTGRDSIIARRRAVSKANAALHDNALAARTEAFAVITPEQLAKLRSVNQSVLNKQYDAAHPASSPASNATRGGGAPGGQGGGRPY